MRRLGADEEALWARVMRTVTPLPGRQAPKPASKPGVLPPMAFTSPRPPEPAPSPRTPSGGNTLDGSWDRKIGRGRIEPDFAVDLHGHTLSSAYQLLDTHLARGIADGARVMLLITGKPPREGRHGRGAIRAAVGDWLAASRHASHIAAVRNAHPRHGGTGALYVILRRPRL